MKTYQEHKNKELLEKYRVSVNDIVKQFIIKQFDLEEEEVPEDYIQYWVEVGGNINIRDYFFHFLDIIFDIETNQPKKLILEWYWFVMENQEKFYINYQSYARGLRSFSGA